MGHIMAISMAVLVVSVLLYWLPWQRRGVAREAPPNPAEGFCASSPPWHYSGPPALGSYVDVSAHVVQLDGNWVPLLKVFERLVDGHADRLFGAKGQPLRQYFEEERRVGKVRVVCGRNQTKAPWIAFYDDGHSVVFGDCDVWRRQQDRNVFWDPMRVLYNLGHESFHYVVATFQRRKFGVSGYWASMCLSGSTYEAQAEWAALVALRTFHLYRMNVKGGVLHESDWQSYYFSLWNATMRPSLADLCLTALEIHNGTTAPYHRLVAVVAGHDLAGPFSTHLMALAAKSVSVSGSWLCKAANSSIFETDSRIIWDLLENSSRSTPWVNAAGGLFRSVVVGCLLGLIALIAAIVVLQQRCFVVAEPP